jgi:hypothetical protein
MTVPEAGEELRIASLGLNAGLLDGKIREVKLLGSPGWHPVGTAGG